MISCKPKQFSFFYFLLVLSRFWSCMVSTREKCFDSTECNEDAENARGDEHTLHHARFTFTNTSWERNPQTRNEENTHPYTMKDKHPYTKSIKILTSLNIHTPNTQKPLHRHFLHPDIFEFTCQMSRECFPSQTYASPDLIRR